MAARGIIAIGRLIMHIFARGVRSWLRADRCRIGMLRLVGVIANRRLSVLFLPRRVAAWVGEKFSRRWRCCSRRSRCRAARRQGRDRLGQRDCGGARQYP